MVEYVRRAQGGLDLEDRLQQSPHPLRLLDLDSSHLQVAFGRSIRIVLEGLEVSTGFSRATVELADLLEKEASFGEWMLV